MDLRTLHTFRVAARTLNFTQTAAAVGYAQSSVTAQMKALEASLGVPLFDRMGRRLSLTAPGKKLLVYADRLLVLAEEARAAVRSGAVQGSLSIAAPESVSTYLLPPLLCRFRASFPEVKLQFVPLPVRDFKRALLDGSLDAAYILEESFSPGSLRLEHLRDEPLAVLAHPGHALTRRAAVTTPDLVGETILLTELGCSYRNLFERTLINAGAHPGPRMDFQSIETIKRCVEAGLGVAALPRMAVAAELEQGRLAELAWRGPDLGVKTQLAWSDGRWMSPALEAFVALSRRILVGRSPASAARPRSGRRGETRASSS